MKVRQQSWPPWLVVGILPYCLDCVNNPEGVVCKQALGVDPYYYY